MLGMSKCSRSSTSGSWSSTGSATWRLSTSMVGTSGRSLGLPMYMHGAQELRQNVNEEIKDMVLNLHAHGHIKGEGLATHSRAKRGRRARIEDKGEDVQDVQAASSSSRRPAPPATREHNWCGTRGRDSSSGSSSDSIDACGGKFRRR